MCIRDRLEIVKEVKGGKQRSKVAEASNVTTSYISKLMKPEYIAKLEKAREMDLNLEALRAPTPVHEDLEMRDEMDQRCTIAIRRKGYTVYTAADFVFCSLPPTFPCLSHAIRLVLYMLLNVLTSPGKAGTAVSY